MKKKPKTKKVRTKKVKKDAKKTPSEFSVPIYNIAGSQTGSFIFNKKVFTGKVNKGVLYHAVRMYNANKRQGNASTKTRGDVSGGGKKPWRQKGTGRARAGSIRSPLWRGGGVVFGPHPRDFSYSLPRNTRRLALLASINSKLNEKKLIGIDSMKIAESKTKQFKKVLDALKLKGKSLFVLDNIDENLKRASRNLGDVLVRDYRDFNTMDVLACDTVVMSKVALAYLPERVK